jgi:tRNA-splicing ligase RtcB
LFIIERVVVVRDPAAAAQLGVHAGQVTLQLHNGGGVLTGQIGEMYARRRSASRLLRTEMAVLKPLVHARAARRAAEARRRYALYFTAGTPSIPVDGDEGRRVLLAQRLSMNYGFAYRLATLAALRRFAQEAFGARLDLVVDSPHNSVYEEEVDGRPAHVHRHNAARAWTPARMAGHPVFAQTGQPLLLPGTNRTSSFLCVPAADAHRSLFTACHGTGSIISSFVREGRSGPDPRGRSTDCYSYGDSAPRTVEHLDDLGVGEGLDILVRNGLVRPVARMRPFAVLS